jgi:RHS repeat-associated protein
VTAESKAGIDFRFGYTGRELDKETGDYYYRSRYYDSTVGRFISEDRIGFDGGDSNLYRYVFNSPTNYTDPTGEIVPSKKYYNEGYST